jgi:hypothetical protein
MNITSSSTSSPVRGLSILTPLSSYFLIVLHSSVLTLHVMVYVWMTLTGFSLSGVCVRNLFIDSHLFVLNIFIHLGLTQSIFYNNETAVSYIPTAENNRLASVCCSL